MIKVTAFKWVPPIVQGLVRDLRIRWALEEAGFPYEEKLIDFDELSKESYKQLQPFGQVPAYESDEVTLFESGAIVQHIAEKSEALFPKNPVEKERAKVWMFAALSSVELFVADYLLTKFQTGEKEWARLYLPEIEQLTVKRLGDLSTWLGSKEYLEGDRFTAGDLLMSTVLRQLATSDILKKFPNLEAYHKRCEARPAFQKALKAQLDAFARNQPPAKK